MTTSDTLFTAEGGVSVRAELEDGILCVFLGQSGLIVDLYADSAAEDKAQPVAATSLTYDEFVDRVLVLPPAVPIVGW